MDSLTSYLIMTGALTPPEAFLLRRLIMDGALKKSTARAFLKKLGFANFKDVTDNLNKKGLIKVGTSISLHWEGLSAFIDHVRAEMSGILHDLARARKIIESATRSPLEVSSAAKTGVLDSYDEGSGKHGHSFNVKDFFLAFDGNKPSLSEKRLLEDVNDPLPILDLLEDLQSLGLVKIQENKRSRTISLTADGAAVRYLFRQRHHLNRLNIRYLEHEFLKPMNHDWNSFMEKIRGARITKGVNSNLNSRERTFFHVLERLNLILVTTNDTMEVRTNLEPPPFSEDEAKQVEQFVKGFIPVYVKTVHGVLVSLNVNMPVERIVTTLDVSKATVSAVTRMLVTLELVTERRDKNKKQLQLTALGQELATMEEKQFHHAFGQHLLRFPTFKETLKLFSRHPNDELGFLGVSGYFRAHWVFNCNPAKALAVLRLLAQTGTGITEVKHASGKYRLKENGVKRDVSPQEH